MPILRIIPYTSISARGQIIPVKRQPGVATFDPSYLKVTNMPVVSKMPVVVNGMDAITCNAAKVVFRQVFVKRTGKLKVAKPIAKIAILQDDTLLHASANYIWRMLCFDLCDFRPYNSLPCTAMWDLNNYYWLASLPPRPDWLATLDETIRQVESTIPATEHYGALHWGYSHDCLAAHANKKEQSV